MTRPRFVNYGTQNFYGNGAASDPWGARSGWAYNEARV